jgi:hypothetical protein
VRHEAIVRLLLDEDRKVGIGIRDTAISDTNPYTFLDRANMVAEAMKGHWMDGSVEVFKVPDFDQMIVGRDVGWEMREVELPEDTVPASATNLRTKLRQPMWITGRPRSGKTTLAQAIQNRLGKTAVVLDGDAMRRTISPALTLTDDDRIENNRRIAALAQELTLQGLTAIGATVSPTWQIRHVISSICNPIWIHTYRTDQINEPAEYVEPVDCLKVDMDATGPLGRASFVLERLAVQ